MIANEREYAASRGRRRESPAVRATYLAHPQQDPLAQEWLVASVDSMLVRADAEIGEYKALRAGGVRAVPVAGLGTWPGRRCRCGSRPG